MIIVQKEQKFKRVRGANFPFSFGDYIAKALLGSMDPMVSISSYLNYYVYLELSVFLGSIQWTNNRNQKKLFNYIDRIISFM